MKGITLTEVEPNRHKAVLLSTKRSFCDSCCAHSPAANQGRPAEQPALPALTTAGTKGRPKGAKGALRANKVDVGSQAERSPAAQPPLQHTPGATALLSISHQLLQHTARDGLWFCCETHRTQPCLHTTSSSKPRLLQTAPLPNSSRKRSSAVLRQYSSHAQKMMHSGGQRGPTEAPPHPQLSWTTLGLLRRAGSTARAADGSWKACVNT